MKIDSSLPALDLVNLPQRRLVEQHEHNRELIQAAKAINESDLMGGGRELMFSLDQHSERMLIRIVDRESGEVVQQIPAEEVLRMAERLKLAQRERFL